MLRIPVTAVSPTTLTFVFKTPTFGENLTRVSSVHLNVLRRDGTSTVWNCSIVSANPGEIVFTYEFQNAGELTGTGTYYLAPIFVIPGSAVPGETVTLFVTTPFGLPQLVETSGWLAATVPIDSLGPVKNSWVRVGVSSSPYQALATSPWIAVDLSSGSVAVALWSGNDGDSVVLSDFHNQAGIGGSLILTAKNGARVPQGDGTYGASATYTAAGFVAALKLDDGDWLPWEGKSTTQASGGSGLQSIAGTGPLSFTAGPNPVGSIASATTLAAGLFSAADKTILDLLPGAITAVAALAASKVASVSGTAGRIVSTGTTAPILDLVATGVTSGSYSNASFAVDQFGRILSASSGSAPAPVPSGTNGVVQFANASGSAFASNPLLVWDDLIGALGAGMTPVHRLDVAAFDATLPAPTGLAITPILETVVTPATITGVTQVNGPENASGVNGAINDPDGNGIFTADSSADWTCNVWATLTVNGTQYISDTPQSFDFGTDAGDSNPISFSINWTPGSGADGFYYELYQNGNPVFLGFVAGGGSSSTVVNNASVPSTRGPSFSSIAYAYRTPGTPPTALSGASCAPQYGSGAYVANGSSYSYSIDGCTTIDGIEYASGAPVSGGSFSDDNSGNPFYVEIDFSPPGGSNDNTVVQGQINGGAFFYFFGGNSGIANDFSAGGNDPAAQAAWLRTYPGPVAITHSYDVSGIGTSPSTYYSAGQNGFNFPAFNSPTGYVLFIAINYAGATALQKLRGSSSGALSNSQTVTSTSIFDTPNVWGGDSTLTPKHVGLLGDGTSYAFQMYGRVTSPATLFSNTHADISYTIPNDGLYRYLNINWTTAVGTTTTKVLRSINGGGFTSGYQSGFMQGLIQYVASTTFSDGITVTPNTTTGIAANFQNGASTVVDAPQARLKSTGGSAARLDFVNSSDAFCASIGIEPSTIRTLFASTVGLWDFVMGGTKYNTIGYQTTVFNVPGATGYTFRIDGQTGALFTAVSSGNSIAIGSAANIGGGVLTLEPRDSRQCLYMKGFNPTTQNFITAVRGDNTAAFEFDSHGYLSVGGAAHRGKISVIGGDTSNAPLSFDSGTLTTTAQNGSFEYSSSRPYFTPQSNTRQQLVLGPVAGLTSGFIPFADANGFLADSHLEAYNSGNDFRVNFYSSWEFRQNVVFDSGKNLTLNGTGQLQMGVGGNIVLSTTTGTKLGTGTTQKLGFWNVTPVVQQTVTGSRATGAALTSLLSKLALIGIIVDSSTT